RSGPNGVVRLSDVATVAPGTAPQWTRVTADGRDAVVFNVFQQPGGNTVAIARGVQGKLEELRRRLPADVKLAAWYDQSRLIIDSSTSVRDAVLVGIVLAGLVLLLFLRNLRVTMIAALTVPVVLASTVLLLRAMDMSFNIMTLGGMAAAVGLIIDDAIVMVEHVMRRLRRGEGAYEGRVLRAAAEFTRPLAGSSASTIVIFVPLAFLSGVAGAFFKALALTMASGLVVSFFVSWIAVPLLAVRFLRQKDTADLDEGPTTRRFHGAYERIMARVLRRPLWVVAGFAPLLALGYVAYDRIGSGFMPSMDEGGFVLDYRAPSGMSLGETDRLLRQVEEILRATPEVATYSRRTGLQLGGGLTEANEGDFFVQLKPLPRRAIDEVMDDVRGKVERSVPGLEIELTLLMEDLIGDLTAVPQPIEIKLFSDDGRLLRALAPRVAREIGAISGVVDVKSGVVLAGDALTVRVDRDKAALEGTTPEAVAKTLTTLVEGAVTGRIRRGPKMVDVRAWLPAENRARAAQIENLRLRGADGRLFPLKRIATVEVATGQPQITREDLKEMVAVTGRISGRDLGTTIRDVRARLDRRGMLPAGVYYEFGGLYEQQRIAFRGLLGVLAAAVALVFLLLLFLYERFRVAAAMLLTTLLAMVCVFVGLWITGTELNISALMGLTMVVGIVTEVSIFYYSEFADLPPEMGRRARFVAAGRNRMRPIAMTTLAVILALSPLALGIGQGAAMQRPLAIAIVSGLAGQFFLALFVLPALLAAMGVGRGEGAVGPAGPRAAEGDAAGNQLEQE
ncbi:MAG: efflux RND transporter permease subunit, partial [Candidatus Polarisedimenticolia bacterium]